MSKIEEFKLKREKLNKIILENSDLNTKRFFALDNSVYNDGALNAKTKEMLGLAASIVLRCDDCISYHIIQCVKNNVGFHEFNEIFNIALIVGGSIIIPHIRNAYSLLIELEIIKEGETGK